MVFVAKVTTGSIAEGDEYISYWNVICSDGDGTLTDKEKLTAFASDWHTAVRNAEPASGEEGIIRIMKSLGYMMDAITEDVEVSY